jgi:hypothetical protein
MVRERIHELGSNVVAAAADGGSYRRDEILGTAVELLSHSVDGGNGDFRRRSAPTGVDSCHGTRCGVGEENRSTVGDSDRYRHGRVSRDQRIGLIRCQFPNILIVSDQEDAGAVNLLDADHPISSHPYRLAQ